MEDNVDARRREKELWNSIPSLDGLERAETYFNLSLLAFEQGEHTKSLALAETACDCFVENFDDVGSANCLTSIAFNLYALDRKWDAIRVMLRAIMKYSRTSDMQEWEYRGYLAGWLADCGENELALIQYEKCLEHFTYQEFGIAVARFNDDMAKVLCDLDRCDESIGRFQKSRETLRLEREPGLVAAMDISIARCFNHLKDGLSARDFAYRALGVFESGANKYKTAEALIQLGKAYLNLASYQEAFEVLDRAHVLITGWRGPDFYLIYLIQKGKVKALKGLERWEEAETIERRNKAINDIMEYEEEN